MKMNNAQVEYFISRMNEEIERKANAIKQKYDGKFVDMIGLGDDRRRKLIAIANEKHDNYEKILKQMMTEAEAIKDYCVLSDGSDALETLKRFIEHEY